jgi:hypothetical protein
MISAIQDYPIPKWNYDVAIMDGEIMNFNFIQNNDQKMQEWKKAI